MEILFDSHVFDEYCVGFREEVGWIGGLSIGEVGDVHVACEEGVALVLARL